MPKMKVIKFGGSTVRDIPNIVNLVNEPAVIVVSAVKGMTDHLISGDVAAAMMLFRGWLRRRGIRYTENMDMCIDRMWAMPKGSPEAIAFGEKLTAVALSDMMSKKTNKLVAPLFADSFMFAEGKSRYDSRPLPLFQDDVDKIKKLTSNGMIPIVTGFCGQDRRTKRTVLLGRDGSDVTAAFLANALECDCYIVTDTCGVMTCDPRIVPDARTIPVMSHAEARELAFHGANVLHRRTLEAVGSSNLSVIDIHGQGTMIVPTLEEALNRPVAMAVLRNRRAVTVKAQPRAGFCAGVFTALSKIDVSVEMVLQTCSETEVSVVIPDHRSPIAALKLHSFGEVSISEPLGIITLVGDGMAKAVGLANKVFAELALDGINIRCISQGPSERSLSIAVSMEDTVKAAQCIHRTF